MFCNGSALKQRKEWAHLYVPKLLPRHKASRPLSRSKCKIAELQRDGEGPRGPVRSFGLCPLSILQPYEPSICPQDLLCVGVEYFGLHWAAWISLQ